MKKTMILKRILLITLAAVICRFSALADTPAPTMAPTPVPVPPGLIINFQRYGAYDKLPLFKDTLYQLGYYTAMSSDENIRSAFLDDETMNAVYRVCQKNGLISEYHDEGINYTVWDAVINGQIVSADATPAPTQATYEHIYWLTNSPAVAAIQNKLMQLGYQLPGGAATGIYDEDLRQVIKVYCELNGYPYDQTSSNGLTPAFQSRLLEQQSVPYYEITPTPAVTPTPTPEPVKSLGDKLRDHFSDSSSLLGLQVPNIIIWLICFGLIAGCIIAAIHFFSPADPNSKRPGSDKPTRRQTGSGRLEFTIEYKGIVQTYRCNIDHALKIGRNVGNFPLNMQDTLISRKHCEIYYFDQSLWLRDYSSNGTRINGKICSREEYILYSGDVIQMGDHRITIRF